MARDLETSETSFRFQIFSDICLPVLYSIANYSLSFSNLFTSQLQKVCMSLSEFCLILEKIYFESQKNRDRFDLIVTCRLFSHQSCEIKPLKGKQINGVSISHETTLRSCFSSIKWLLHGFLMTNITCSICVRKPKIWATLNDVWLKPIRADLQNQTAPYYSSRFVVMFGDKNYEHPGNSKLKRSISMESVKVWKNTRVRSKINKSRIFALSLEYLT